MQDYFLISNSLPLGRAGLGAGVYCTAVLFVEDGDDDDDDDDDDEEDDDDEVEVPEEEELSRAG